MKDVADYPFPLLTGSAVLYNTAMKRLLILTCLLLLLAACLPEPADGSSMVFGYAD